MNIPEIETKLFLKLKFAIAFLIALMCFIAWNNIYKYNEYRNLIYQDIDHLLYSTAIVGSELLGADYHNNLTSKNSISAADQIKNERYMNIIANTSKVHYVYAVYNDRGIFRISTSSNTPDDYQKNDISNYYDPYPEASPALKNAFKTHKLTHEEYSDKWGTFRSVYIPLQSSNGTWYVMCSDIDLEYVTKLLNHALWKFLITPFLLLFLLSGLGFYYMRLSVKVMQQLGNSNKQLSDLRDTLEEKIAEKTLDLEDKNIQLERFNTSLEERVQEEVLKNRQQEQHMMQQSCLAQLGEMISMIAHQWRQPLAAIGSSVLDLKTKLALQSFDLETQQGTDECNAYIDTSLTNVEKHILILTNTIDDFRDFYKSDKRMNKLPMHRPIEKAVNVISSTMKDENITLLQEYRATRTVDMYDGELMQVFLSILKNAQDNFIQKVTPNPVIIITTYHTQNGGVGVTFCDNGGGIPLDVIDKIFDPYFSTKKDLNGTGLGLYLSKTIIEDHHHGTLLAYNTQQGVCFKIELEGIKE